MSKENIREIDPGLIIEAGKLIKSKREEQQKTRAYLSKKTRISVAVIQAIENGWRDQLPERPYLTTMLRILEKELNLKSFILDDLISLSDKDRRDTKSKSNKYTSKEFLTSYQGVVIYLICMLLSIFFLNKYQLTLSINNSTTINPMTTVDPTKLKE